MSEIKVNSVVNSTGDNDSGLDLSTNDKIGIKIANAEVATVDTTGVVFNDASADRDFRVESNNQANMLFVDGGNDTVSFQPNSGTLTIKAGSGDATNNVRLEAGGTTSTYLESRGYLGHQFYVDTTEIARMDSNGMLLGTSSTTIDTSNFGILLANSPKGQIKHARDATASQYIYRGFGNAGNFNIQGDGDATNTNNRYTGISDRKLKENEKPANSQWEDIKALQIKNYNFKEYPNRKHIGVIAQDLEESGMSSLVKEDEDGIKSVAYSILYIKAMKALQEAMTRIETLEAKVTALENAE